MKENFEFRKRTKLNKILVLGVAGSWFTFQFQK